MTDRDPFEGMNLIDLAPVKKRLEAYRETFGGADDAVVRVRAEALATHVFDMLNEIEYLRAYVEVTQYLVNTGLGLTNEFARLHKEIARLRSGDTSQPVESAPDGPIDR